MISNVYIRKCLVVIHWSNYTFGSAASNGNPSQNANYNWQSESLDTIQMESLEFLLFFQVPTKWTAFKFLFKLIDSI